MRKAAIGIDCRLGGVRHAGIGRYIAEYVQRVVGYQNFNFVLVFSDREQQAELLAPIPPKLQSQIRVQVTSQKHYSVTEQLQLPSVLNRLQLDLLHVPHFNVPLGYRRPFVVTIHDLLWHSTRGTQVTTLPAYQYWLKYAAYQLTVKNAVGRAARIFTPTQYVADSVAQHFPRATDKIVVAYEGVGHQFQADPTAVRDRKQLLYVGSLYPHKNVTVVLDALPLLPNHRLTIVSARNVFTDAFQLEIAKRKLEHRVTIRHQVTDQQLVKLYNTVGALIQPSTSEGFGLTGIEAIACNTPLVASDIPVFHEVYADAAQYFAPHDPQSLATAIQAQSVGDHPTQQTKTRSSVLERYSWDRMTKTMIMEMQHVLAAHNSP